MNNNKEETKTVKVNVIYGDKRLVDCMKNIIKQHIKQWQKNLYDVYLHSWRTSYKDIIKRLEKENE